MKVVTKEPKVWRIEFDSNGHYKGLDAPPSQELTKDQIVQVVEKAALDALKIRLTESVVQAYYGHCNKCEPVGCCAGLECGCMGMPVSYKPTKDCEFNCMLKALSDKEEKIKKALAFFEEICSPDLIQAPNKTLADKNSWILAMRAMAQQAIKEIATDSEISESNYVRINNRNLRIERCKDPFHDENSVSATVYSECPSCKKG